MTDEIYRYIDSRFDDLDKHLARMWANAETIRATDNESSLFARGELSRRLNEGNEYRAQIEHERGDFLRVDRYEERHEALRLLQEVSASRLGERISLLEKANIEQVAVNKSREGLRHNVYAVALLMSGFSATLVGLLIHFLT